MIRFSCDNCGHKIGAREDQAGKQGRCSGCGGMILVPQQTALIGFLCGNCGERIRALRTQAGKKGKCPRCKLAVAIPDKSRGGYPVQKLRAPIEEPNEDKICGLSLEERQLLGGETRESETEPPGQRKLPWPVDIFLYPTNVSGLVHVAVLLLVPILLKLFLRFIIMGLGPRACLLMKIFYIFFVGYVFSYLVECIRDSAGGELRASDPPSVISGWDELLGQYVLWLSCCAFFFGPVTFYYSYINLCGTQINNAIFWPLLAYGVFFFPMGILAATMFDSVNGLNPILLICSIVSTFFQYCGLIIFFGSFCFLRIGLLILSLRQRWGILANIVPDLLLIWLLLVTVHLIGRFYWRYQEKLNWEA